MTDAVTHRSVPQGGVAPATIALCSSLLDRRLFAQSAPVASTVFCQRETQMICYY